MRIRFWHLAVVLALAGGVYWGAQYGGKQEASRIQASCEDGGGPAVINGTEYLCLSRRQLEIMHERYQSVAPGA